MVDAGKERRVPAGSSSWLLKSPGSSHKREWVHETPFPALHYMLGQQTRSSEQPDKPSFPRAPDDTCCYQAHLSTPGPPVLFFLKSFCFRLFSHLPKCSWHILQNQCPPLLIMDWLCFFFQSYYVFGTSPVCLKLIKKKSEYKYQPHCISLIRVNISSKSANIPLDNHELC